MSHTPAESKVQIATEGTGPKVRTLQLSTILADGSLATVEMEIVAIADEKGHPIDLEDRAWKEEVLTELRTMRTALWEMLGRPVLPAESLHAKTKGGKEPWI